MRLSVVIPTLNEATHVARTIAATRALGSPDAVEILVVDGGSADGTLEAATGADVRLDAPRGRASQQNVGAAAATGDVLLFLHADCRLEPGALEAVRSALADVRVVGGCFRQRIEAEGAKYRWLERGNAFRARVWNRAYGDQALFVRRDVFERIGGFPDVPLMEDLVLSKRLRRAGRLALLDAHVRVSARRWQRHGVVTQTLRNWAMLTAYHCGVSPRRLARFYPNHSE